MSATAIVEFRGATFVSVPLDILGGVTPSVGAIVILNGMRLKVTSIEIEYYTDPNVLVETEWAS